MALAEERLRSIIESLLLISPDPLPMARLIEVIRIEDPQTEEAAVRRAISTLLSRYGHPDRPVGRGFHVEDVAGGYQLRTVAENAQYVRRFLAAKPQRLTKAALETLSVIAYRQPATKPEIEAVRGVDVGAALKGLLERDLIRILGKKEEVGRPIIYGTTEHFLEFFGLRSLNEMPTLREYHELDEEHSQQVEELEVELGLGLSELADAAEFLQERQEDPELDALDEQIKDADRVRRVAKEVLGLDKKDDEAEATADGEEALNAEPNAEAPNVEAVAAPNAEADAAEKDESAPAEAPVVEEQPAPEPEKKPKSKKRAKKKKKEASTEPAEASEESP